MYEAFLKDDSISIILIKNISKEQINKLGKLISVFIKVLYNKDKNTNNSDHSNEPLIPLSLKKFVMHWLEFNLSL